MISLIGCSPCLATHHLATRTMYHHLATHTIYHHLANTFHHFYVPLTKQIPSVICITIWHVHSMTYAFCKVTVIEHITQVCAHKQQRGSSKHVKMYWKNGADFCRKTLQMRMECYAYPHNSAALVDKHVLHPSLPTLYSDLRTCFTPTVTRLYRTVVH